MSDSLLATKLFVPHFRPELVSRGRLIKQLDEGLHRKLTLISAPAGFGKTTLTTEWIGKLTGIADRNEYINIAWLSLDQGDNDPHRFLTYFVSALNRIGRPESGIGNTALGLLKAPQPPSAETVFTSLINEITSLECKIVFVLDDFHLIESDRIYQAMNFWIENSPPRMHLIILTREDPPIPLARLRARNLITELRSDDLRFSETEAARFLNEVMGLKLDTESVSALEERTEGWVAGLQMAALSMRNRKDVGTFIEKFSGTNRYILDYLLEEVLNNQPEEIRNFLLNTSILKRLSAPLCDALLPGSDQSESILSYLEKTNLFLISLDDNRIWYRYHHLFADLLSAMHSRLSQSDLDLSTLHSRAAEWYEENGHPYDAIYHASLIPDIAWVERLIDRFYMEIFQRNDSASIRYWTGELSKELIFKRPGLSIHEANSRAWLGQIDEAELLLNEAEKRLRSGTLSPETRGLLGHLTYIRSRVTAMRGDFKEAIRLCLMARDHTDTGNYGLLGGIGVMLAYGYFLDGNFDDAVTAFEETIRIGKISGAINTTIGSYCVLARLFTIRGQLHKSYEIYQQALKFLSDAGGEHRGAKSIVDAGIAELLYEWNDLSAAQAHLTQALEAILLWSKADDIALAYVTRSRLEIIQEDLQAAKKSISIARQEIDTKGVFPESRDAVKTAEVKLHLMQGDKLAINLWKHSMEKRLLSKNPFRFENELPNITLARVYLQQRKLEEALTLLAQLEESAQNGGRNGRLVEIVLLKALVMKERGKPELAADALKKSLELAEPGGYIRIYLDEGDPVRLLIAQWLVNCNESPMRSYAEYILSQFALEPQGGQKPRLEISASGNLIEPLSPRELEVLQLIALGNTNKEIASQLIVSPGTVKAHTSSIYRKLDVENRTEAVACARRLAIIP